MLVGQNGSLVRETLFHGTRGNGKSDALIMGFCQHVGKGWGDAWRGIIFRKEHKNLDDLVSTAQSYIPKIFPDAVWNETKYRFTFKDGEQLIFQHIKTHKDYENKFHGHEYAYIGWDEVCTWKDEELYEDMLSCLRTAFIPTEEQPEMPPLQVRSATNPWGEGKKWVYNRFIKGQKDGVPVFNEDGQAQRISLFGTVFENKYIDKSYINDFLKKIKDPGKRAAWLHGDWETIDTNTIFGPVWSDNIEIDPFDVPANWRVDRAFDWGQSTPYCALWFAKSNGEEVALQDGRVMRPPAGSIFVVGEDYGTEEDEDGNQVKDDLGLFLPARKVARRVISKERLLKGEFRKDGELLTDPLRKIRRVIPGPADTQIWNGSKVGGQKTVAKEMEDEGLKWERADKRAGSRLTSSQIIFNRLSSTQDQDPESPHLYIFSSCRYLLRALKHAPRDSIEKDAVGKFKDDHAVDVLMYRLGTKEKSTLIRTGFF